MKIRLLPLLLLLVTLSISCSEDNNPVAPIIGEHAGQEHDFEIGSSGVMITMVWIPAGSFMMGAKEDEFGADADEYPRHDVTIDAGFWMGKYEVTRAQHTLIQGWPIDSLENPNHGKGSIGWSVSMWEAELLNRLNNTSKWRLPSEAEWEYACRAGTETRYYWGDDLDSSLIGDYANYHGNDILDRGSPKRVGTKIPNAWGLYDMIGNVSEWCEDIYNNTYNSAPADGSVWLTGVDTNRVLRGRSTHDNAYKCRSARRSYSVINLVAGTFGFRLVRDP